MEEETDPFENLPDVVPVTILIGDGPPKVDIGQLSPQYVASVLRNVAKALEECMLPPVIEYDGETLYNPYIEYEWEEDDED